MEPQVAETPDTGQERGERGPAQRGPRPWEAPLRPTTADEWHPWDLWGAREVHVASGAAVLIPMPGEAGLPEDVPRRLLNVLTSVMALIVTAPLMALIALLVKLTSEGPVFYTQPRVGVDRRHPTSPSRVGRRTEDCGGTVFHIIKFRTMYEGSDSWGQVWATDDDPRVTPLGRFLRKSRLDELPQLLNVLKGDMNIVGPRPEQPQIFQRLRRELPQYDLRQRVRPGITGLAQINLHYDRDIEDVRRKLGLDLEYLRRSSTLEDLRIMLRTFPVMLQKVGW